MSIPIAIGLYFICWWLAFFIVLPIGVRIPEESALEPGMADSAPIAPFLWRKALGATILSAIIFAAVYLVIAYRLIPLELFPSSLRAA
jgi:predicted secreted protein